MKRANCLFITMGCAKNEVDTDRMRALLNAAGIGESKTVEDADVAVVNTCSFLAAATQESLEVTLQLAEEAHAGARQLPIVMCGCVPSRYGEELVDELPEVAAFVRADEEDNIVRVVCDVLGLDDTCALGPAGRVLRTVQGASAYLKISDGCDRFCTFCAIPHIRGRYWSRPPEELFEEARELMRGGVRELVLIGQDTGVWGTDLEDTLDLAWLLEEMARIVRPYGGWVRVLYLQPEGMTERLIEVMRDVDEVLPYIDIPVQHCSTRVLKRMGRRGSAQAYKALFERLRARIPNMVLRTTGLVGFPGETEAEFDELMEFVEDVAFDYTSVFAYSREDGTAAARLDGQIDEEVKLARAQELLDVAERLGFAATARHVGEEADVIIDGVEQTDEGPELIGHTWFQAPDCDGAVHIASGEATVGEKVRCVLVDSFCYELVGQIKQGA